MLTLQECIDLSELSEEEILAIAEHENLTEAAALELGNYLVHTSEGERRIRRMILEDIDAARIRGDLLHVAKLKLVLKHFVDTHSGAR